MMIFWSVVLVTAALAAQLSPRMATLVDVVRPALPFPASSAAGDVPSDNNSDARWFVVWPSSSDDARIVVRANPLHPDVQALGAAAMGEINAAVAAAERRAQASYDRALEQLRKTGRSSELENVSLDDEGVAGERIDAELEVTIELSDVSSFVIATGEAPVVAAGADGPAWVVTVPPNTYRPTTGDDRRDHFRASEVHLYFGSLSRPEVQREGETARFRVDVTPVANAFSVVIRGNTDLVTALVTRTDWSPLVTR